MRVSIHVLCSLWKSLLQFLVGIFVTVLLCDIYSTLKIDFTFRVLCLAQAELWKRGATGKVGETWEEFEERVSGKKTRKIQEKLPSYLCVQRMSSTATGRLKNMSHWTRGSSSLSIMRN